RPTCPSLSHTPCPTDLPYLPYPPHPTKMDLQNKTALITGGRRIGAAVAIGLAARGVDVALSYARSQAEALDAAERVRAAGRRSATFHADLSQVEDARALVQSVVDAIAPGPILGPPGTTDDERRAVEEATPLGRWGGEIEIVKGVLALLESDFITGETLRIDGGRHVK